MAWTLSGSYFETCNCDVLCPCLTSSDLGPADAERCLVPNVYRIDAGQLDDIGLGGLGFVWLVDSPAIMADGDWTLATYIDERADERQREALSAITSGRLGGVPAVIATLVGRSLGPRFVPMEHSVAGHRRAFRIPGIMDLEVEGIVPPGQTSVMEITGTTHFMSSTLPVASALRGFVHDPEFGFSFDNRGRNAHYRDFAWQG